MKRPLIILSGPTAVGKTELSIALAKAINGEIISSDSMQVYKQMNIGSAKITPEEMEGVKHYLVDELEPDEEFNVTRFQQLAYYYIEKIYEKGRVPILVGGTGFYIQSVLYGIDFTKTEKDTSYRKELEQLAKEKGAACLHSLLKKVDEKSAIAIHQNNIKRVIRALEYYKQTGMRISEHNEEQRKKQSAFHFSYFVLNDIREQLYNRINLRIDKMLEQGLIDEVKALRNRGYTRDMTSMQGLGYKEILSYLDGECTLEEAISILKRDTRHFAKRQLTWFRRESDVIWIQKNELHYDTDLILQTMLEELRRKELLPFRGSKTDEIVLPHF